MKTKLLKYKNLILFLVLILFLGVTYLVEEKGSIHKKSEQDKAAMILDTNSLGEMKSFKGIKIDIEKRGDEFFDKENGLRLSDDRLAEAFQILSQLRVVQVLDPIEVAKVGKTFYIPEGSFTLSFEFEKGKLDFTLGKKLDYDQNFYMEVNRDGVSQVLVATDISPDPGVYENEEDYKVSDVKYKRLQIVFLLTNKYFHETEVLKSLKYDKEEKINFESITISTFRNKKFTVDFKKLVTQPAPPKAISYFEDNWLSFHHFLTNLNAKGIVENGNKALLGEILSHFDVVDRKGNKYSLELYKLYQNQNGYFLKTSLNDLIYEIRPEDAKHFFVNVQDFWNKKFDLTKDKAYDLDISFYDGRQNKVRVEDGELFKVKLEGKGASTQEARVLEFKKLIDFFKTSGDHVSDFAESPSEVLKKSVLKVVFNNKAFNVILEDNDAMIVDFENKVKIHYYVGATLPFSIKFDDYFIKK